MSVAEKLQELKYWTSLDGGVLYIDNQEIASKIRGEEKLALIKEFAITVNVKKSIVTINKCEIAKKMCSVLAKILAVSYISEQMFQKYKNDSEEHKAIIAQAQQQGLVHGAPLKPAAEKEAEEQPKEEPKWVKSGLSKKRQQVRRPEVPIEDNILVVTAKTSAINATKEQIANVLCLDPSIDFQRIIFKSG